MDERRWGNNSPGAEKRRQFVASGMACIGLLAACVVATWSLLSALQAQAGATAAAELRAAATTVASADAIGAAGGDIGGVELASAVSELSADTDRALSSLRVGERERADALLTEAAARGISLLSNGERDGQPQDYEALETILAVASERAGRSADEARRRLLGSLVVVALTAGLVAWTLIRTRARELKLRDDLAAQASTDLLTGAGNRRAMQLVLDQIGRQMTSSPSWTGFALFDLDGFKAINDSLGYAIGDDVLRQVADRLGRTCRHGDHLVRLGGDEFVLVLPGLVSADEAERAASRFLQVLSRPFTVGGDQERVRISVGVTATDEVERLELLNVEADVAMDEAKRRGGNTLVVFEPSMEVEAGEAGRLTRAIRAADYDEEFRLVYQPIVTIGDSEVLGYEALLRWTSPTVGEVGPSRFIPIAEQAGEITTIGRWVIEQACDQLARWTMDGSVGPISVSCNVSAIQLAEDDFVDFVVGTVDRFGLPRHRLILEVTESAVLDRRGASIDRLGALRDAGFRVSIDDFGSGYSNLGQLLEVPFDILKVDRSLLVTLTAMRERRGGDPSEACAILSAIVSIAGVFGAPVVCEGVETEQQRLSLLASGITHVQGYLTGRPIPPEEIDAGRPRLVSV